MTDWSSIEPDYMWTYVKCQGRRVTMSPITCVEACVSLVYSTPFEGLIKQPLLCPFLFPTQHI